MRTQLFGCESCSALQDLSPRPGRGCSALAGEVEVWIDDFLESMGFLLFTLVVTDSHRKVVGLEYNSIQYLGKDNSLKQKLLRSFISGVNS